MDGIGVAEAANAMTGAQCMNERACPGVQTTEPGGESGEKLGRRDLYAPLIRERGGEFQWGDTTPLKQCNGWRTVPTF